MKKITCLAVAALSLFFITACNNAPKQEDSVDQAQNINEDKKINDDDSKFVTEAAGAGMKEVEVGKLGAERATNADVKSFAQKMVDDHSKANAELKDLAAKKSITIPTEMDNDTKSALEDLGKKTGMDFDKDFMDKMVSDHKDAVSKFEKASTDCKDADIKAWAAAKLPTLRMHLEMAEKMHDALKDNKDTKMHH